MDTYKEMLSDLANFNVTSLNHNFVIENSENEKPNFSLYP